MLDRNIFESNESAKALHYSCCATIGKRDWWDQLLLLLYFIARKTAETQQAKHTTNIYCATEQTTPTKVQAE
jgi:hypothetical protein